MEALSTTATLTLRRILDAQPVTAAKVSFAWTMAAGPAMSRATQHEWRDGVLRVRARTDAWVQELRRARPLLSHRLNDLLGPDTIKQLVIEQESSCVKPSSSVPSARPPGSSSEG